MAEEILPPPPDETPPPTDNGIEPPGAPPTEEFIPYNRFKKMSDQAAELQAKLTAIEAEQKAQTEKRLADQKKWKELAEQREQELKDRDVQLLRLTVASAKGLPPDLAARLQGSTQEEMEADADTLLQFMRPSTPPGVPPAGRSQQANVLDLTVMSPEQIRAARKEGKLSF